MNEKDMVNDYLSSLNSSVTNYANVIVQCSNPQLRQTFQQMRDADENRQFRTYQMAEQKGYYQPASPARPDEIQKVRSQLQGGGGGQQQNQGGGQQTQGMNNNTNTQKNTF